jgi:hypothetical protein
MTPTAKLHLIDLVHDIPGRIRFAIPALKSSAARGQALRAYVEAITGVAAARVSPLTGSLIIEYDGAARTRGWIFEALHQVGYDVRIREPLSGSAKRSSPLDAMVTGAFAKAFVRMIVEEALSAAVVAII